MRRRLFSPFRFGSLVPTGAGTRVAVIVFLAASIALSPMRAFAAAPPSNETPDVIVDPQAEQVIKGALRYLAAKQSAQGYWTSATGNHHAAITAYVLICYMS